MSEELFKCCRCKEHLERGCFGGVTKRNDYCKSCSLQISRDYREVNRDQLNATNRACAARRYATNRQNLIDYLTEHPCVDCGHTTITHLQFDHIGTKRSAISNVLGSWNWQNILKEIDQCEVRCAHCHIDRTGEQFGWYKSWMLPSV